MLVSRLAFACYDKSCAPPPAGTGGSSKSKRGPGEVKHLVKNKSIANVDDARLTGDLAKLHQELHTGEGLRAFSDTKRSLIERGMKARMIVHELQKRGHPKPDCKFCALTGNEEYTGPMGDAIAKYKAASAKGDTLAAAKAAVEWAGLRADQVHPNRKVPDISDKLAGWFMGPQNAKGRQKMIIVPKNIADAWRKNNPPQPEDTRPVKTKYHP